MATSLPLVLKILFYRKSSNGGAGTAPILPLVWITLVSPHDPNPPKVSLPIKSNLKKTVNSILSASEK